MPTTSKPLHTLRLTPYEPCLDLSQPVEQATLTRWLLLAHAAMMAQRWIEGRGRLWAQARWN